jgi:uncharacterized membrane protein YccC
MSKTPPSSPDYVPCVECGFWIHRRARHCPNCGLFKPQKRPWWKKALLWTAEDLGETATGGANVGAVGGAVVGAVGGAVGGGSCCVVQVIMAVVGAVIGAVVGGVIGAVVGAVVGTVVGTVERKRRQPNNLRQRETLLNERLRQISQQVEKLHLRQQQLEQRWDKAERQGRPTEHLARGIQAMEQAWVALKQHEERLQRLLHHIHLRRWQNSLIPFLVCLQEAYSGKSQRGVLQEHINEARRALADAPPEFGGKLRDLIDRAERLNDKLHDEYLLRLAADDLRRVRPIEEAYRLDLLKPIEEDNLRDLVEPLLEELDLEDSTLALGEEWDDLEEEYRRLTSEMEAVEEVEQLVSRGAG